MSVIWQVVNRSLLLVAASVVVSHAVADITIEQRVTMEGGGLLKMMNMSGETVTTISGNRARTQSDLRMESRIMRMFGGGSTAEIVRLDEGRIYQLDLEKKTYAEMSLAEQKAALEQSMTQMREAQESQQQGAAGVDQESCEWSDPKATVERPGDIENIAGALSERVIVTATQSCRDRNTGKVCDFNLILDQWIAADFEAGDEVRDYYQAYAEQLGLDIADSPGFAQRLESMFGAYQGIWSEIAAQMEETQGYPMRSTVSLAVGGPQCGSVEQAQQAGRGPGIGEAVGGALGGALGGILGRGRDRAAQKAEEEAAATEQSDLPEGTVELMSISTETVSVERGAAPAGTFDVPADFRQVER